ncbi:Crp/Fnr family transcriptional regulator [Streptomyces polygonati]|uniref:Crp/Fnr family transcriptional regulator n=1 Tax=Streptomyces polygonati TaxID=1617087 RepID=A0ABV8HUR4_9ACTN
MTTIPPSPLLTPSEARRLRKGARTSAFLDNLPPGLAAAVLGAAVRKSVRRGTTLKDAGYRATHVFLVESGCITEQILFPEAGHMRPASLRFRQAGSVIGENDLSTPFNPQQKTEHDASLYTTIVTCLTPSVVDAIPIVKMREFLDSEPAFGKALLASVAKSSTESQMVYANSRLAALQRVAHLLLYLSEWSHSSEQPPRLTVTGPTQTNLAEALMLGRASIEAALRELRDKEILSTNHRTYAIHKPRALWAEAGSPSRIQPDY